MNEYGLNWFKFESRIRKVISEIVTPIIDKNKSIQVMLNNDVVPRMDKLSTMQL